MNPSVDEPEDYLLYALPGEDGCQNLGIGEQKMVAKTVSMG